MLADKPFRVRFLIIGLLVAFAALTVIALSSVNGAGQDTWFQVEEYQLRDLEEDGFNESVAFRFDIDTNESFTQAGHLEIDIFQSLSRIDNASLFYNVTGNVSDPFNWSWTAPVSGSYLFDIHLYNETNLVFENSVHIIDLALPSPNAWFSSLTSTLRDLEEDGFNETVHLEFDLDTWHNRTQQGLVEILVFDSAPAQVQRSLLPFNITGNSTVTLQSWQWSASYDDTYRVRMNLWNEALTELFTSRNDSVSLSVPYDEAWLVSPAWSTRDGDGDGFDETLVLTFDIDTWHNWTQEGWIEMQVKNGSGAVVDTLLVPYNVTGEATDTFTVQWPAPDSDAYSFKVGLSNSDHSSSFQTQNHTLDLEVYDAWFTITSGTWDIVNGDGFNETALFTIEVDTPAGKTATGRVGIYVYGPAGLIETLWLPFNVTGTGGTPISWDWTAPATGAYTFAFVLRGPANDTDVDSEIVQVNLAVNYDKAWFKVTPTHVLNDPNGDGLDEQASFQIDIDTWNGVSQQGWLNISILDTTVGGGRASGIIIDYDELDFNVFGASVDSYIWEWSAGHTDFYTFVFELRAPTKTSVFATRVVKALELKVNRPPTVGLTAEPNPVQKDLSVTLDAGTSQDPDDNIAYYHWDFESDGLVDANTTLYKVDHVFTTPGIYQVQVTVVDTSGESASAFANVTVELKEKDRGVIAGLLGLDVNDELVCLPLVLLLLFLLLLWWWFKKNPRTPPPVVAPAPSRPESITTDGRPMDARHLYFISDWGDLVRVPRTPELERVRTSSQVHIEARAGLKPFHQAMLFYVEVDPQLILPSHFPAEPDLEQPPVSDQKFYRTRIRKEPGYMYFLDGNGHLARTRMARGTVPGGGREVLLEIGLQREPGYLYFVDREGDIARTRRVGGGKEKVLSTGQESSLTLSSPPPGPRPDPVVMRPWKLLYTVNREMTPDCFYTVGKNRNIQQWRLDLDEEALEALERKAEVVVEAKPEYAPGYACQIYYRHPGDLGLPPGQAEPPRAAAKPERLESEAIPGPRPEPSPSLAKARSGAEPTSPPAPRLDLKTYGINKQPGYFYYLDRQGNVSRSRKARGPVPGGDPELVGHLNLQREPGYLYFIDKQGFIAKAPLKRHPKKQE